MYIENDVGRSSFKILNVRRAFEFGYKRLSTNLTKGDYAPTVLTRILYPDFNMLAHRMYIHVSRFVYLLVHEPP